METESLVRIITQEVMRQLRNSGSAENSRPKLLVAVSGASIGFKQSMQELESLSREFELQLILSKNASRIYKDHPVFQKLSRLPMLHDGDFVNIPELISEVKGLVIPLLTFNSLAKLSWGICDTLFLDVVIHCLIVGVPVVAVKNAADLQDAERIGISGDKCSPGLLKVCKENLERLSGLGIKVTDAVGLAAATRDFIWQKEKGTAERRPVKKQIITQEDITAEVLGNKTLVVPHQAILTPLVQDLVKNEGIRVIARP